MGGRLIGALLYNDTDHDGLLNYVHPRFIRKRKCKPLPVWASRQNFIVTILHVMIIQGQRLHKIPKYYQAVNRKYEILYVM